MRCAIVGSGNIGSDLLVKLRRSPHLEPVLMVGVDPDSDGLARARRLGVAATADGVDALLADPHGAELVLEATSAHAHREHAPRYEEAGLTALDLTPAAIGPFVVPPVNLADVAHLPNLNLVTCDGQATVPIVAAIARLTEVRYAEIVSTLASRAAGPGTRANIDEFTTTTACALETVGGARRGKAIIVLNPADPPLIMRNSVFCAIDADADWSAITAAVREMAAVVASYVPGYRVKAGPVFDPGAGPDGSTRVSIFLEVIGAADYLPAYAGNLDIMAAAAVATAEALALARVGAPT